MKRGVVLMNLGGPGTLSEVRPFLYRLFSDPAILVGVPWPFRQLLALFIALVKGGGSVRAYASIGGGSPQLRYTRLQAEGLERALGGAAGGWRVSVGMRASRPAIDDAIRELRDWGAEELLFLPLFPQYSTTTTGTCFTEARLRLGRLGVSAPARAVERWADHPGYVRLLRRTLDESLAKAEAERRADGAAAEPIHVLFSAHSLPMKIIERGDPYPADVDRTVAGVAAGLAYPWTLAFQSRNGPVPWLQPYVEDELRRLGAAGVKRVVIVPVSFVSDHIETLHELDGLYAELARKAGIRRYYRTRAFNDDPEFAGVLKEIASDAGLARSLP